MIGNQGGHLRKPVQPSRTGLSIQELKAMTALRMSQGPEVLMSNFASGIENSQAKSSQQASATSYNNSRSRRQASRAAATMYTDQGDFGLLTPQQPPAMTRVSPSPPPTSASSARVDKQQAHSLTVQELKELTRMRLAREAVGPGSNNTSTSTENDLDMEILNLHTQGVDRKNSANSLLTTTTLESRESDGCSHALSRSGTISPVSDSFVDDSDLVFGMQPTLHLTSGSAASSRRHTNIVIPGYPQTQHTSQSTRPTNLNSSTPRGLSPAPGPSSSQTIYSQATAQMAILMDHQRREMRDASRHQEDNSYESSDQAGTQGFSRQQRFEENRQAEVLRRQRAQEHEFSQKCMMLARQQQQAARERCRSAPFPYLEGINSKPSAEDFRHQGLPSSQYERGDFTEMATLSVDTTLGSRDRDAFQGTFDQSYRGPPSVTTSISDEFRFTDRAGEPYMPPPVLGMMRKQQAMAINMAYVRDMNPGGSVFSSMEIPPPPPAILRNLSSDSMGCSSPSMRHKSALSIACPGPVRERTLSDVNTLAFQMAEACLDSNSNPSTPKFSHRSFQSGLSGGMGSVAGGNTPDYLAQALRRMNSTDSVSSIGSSRDPLSSLPIGSGLSLSAPRGYGQVYVPESFGAETLSSTAIMLCLPPSTETWALG